MARPCAPRWRLARRRCVRAQSHLCAPCCRAQNAKGCRWRTLRLLGIEGCALRGRKFKCIQCKFANPTPLTLQVLRGNCRTSTGGQALSLSTTRAGSVSMRMPRAPGPLLGRTQGVLWPWLLLLLAAGLPSLNAEVAASQPRFVQTADELRSALQDAAPHIELQSHLDLRDRPPLAESAGQSWPYLYRSYTGLQSLRVRIDPACLGSRSVQACVCLAMQPGKLAMSSMLQHRLSEEALARAYQADALICQVCLCRAIAPRQRHRHSPSPRRTWRLASA